MHLEILAAVEWHEYSASGLKPTLAIFTQRLTPHDPVRPDIEANRA